MSLLPDEGESRQISLIDFIKEVYLNLLENDWKMQDIDEMDIMFYFEVLAYKANSREFAGIESVL